MGFFKKENLKDCQFFTSCNTFNHEHYKNQAQPWLYLAQAVIHCGVNRSSYESCLQPRGLGINLTPMCYIM